MLSIVTSIPRPNYTEDMKKNIEILRDFTSLKRFPAMMRASR